MEENPNLALYNRVREVPQEAKKDILAGRLKGKTDINPLWRIQTLTREFGPAGIGWYTQIEKQWTEESGAGERAVFIKLNLFVKVNGEWSKPIEGFGGAMVIAKEQKGPYLDDDASKKAYTDAISQCCRSLGIGADVYWANDATKYQQEKAFAESREQAIEYLQTLTTPQQLQEAWAYYHQYFGEDKEFIKAYNKRVSEVSNGTQPQ